MKKISLLFLTLVLLFSFRIDLKADCYDEELNEWATTAEVKLLMNDERYIDEYYYAYFLYVTPQRDDIVIKVTDKDGVTVEGRKFDLLNIYGSGCYTNIVEETYTIEVYGGKESKCKNELLRTLTYTVPPYNDMIKTQECLKYPDHELCQAFTNKTKDMTQEEFSKKMKEYESEVRKNSFSMKNLLKILKEYGVYIISPFAIISLIYIIRINKYKKKESKG